MAAGQCVVVAIDEKTRNLIASLLKSEGMEATLLTSLGELPATLKRVPVSGILLELVTAIRASPAEKEATKELIELYPFVKFRQVGDEIQLLGQSSLGRFVFGCQQFKPRTIRKTTRQVRHSSVYLSADPAFEDAERVVSVNVSECGCFVYSIRMWNAGDRVRLRFFADNVEISGTVCWSQPWGDNNKLIPGIGIKLDEQKD